MNGIWQGLLLSGAMMMVGCASVSSQRVTAPLGKVKGNGIAGADWMAAEARRVVEADYLRVRAALGEESDSPPFTVEFRKALWVPYEGPAGGFAHGRDVRFAFGGRTIAMYRVRVIELSAERFVEHPERLAKTVRHEMTHLFQHYPRETPRFWGEGIAEYVARELSPEAQKCVCDGKYSSYADGYGCAAAFLKFLQDTRDTNIVQHLHRALKRGATAEGFFAEETGCLFGELWKEFEKTDRYTADARAVEIMRAKVNASKSSEVANELLYEFLRTQPGGEVTVSALRDVNVRINSGSPAPAGWQFAFHPDELDQTGDYPAKRVVHLDPQDRKDRYDYAMVKNSADDDWKVQEILIRDLRNGKVKKRLKPKRDLK